MRVVSPVECEIQERRAIAGGGVYIELSQKTSRWAQIQILDNVWVCQTMSGCAKQCLARTLCGCWRLSRVGLDIVQQGVSVCGWLERDLESLDLVIFTSSTHPSL
jgi:hypothetical protein